MFFFLFVQQLKCVSHLLFSDFEAWLAWKQRSSKPGPHHENCNLDTYTAQIVLSSTLRANDFKRSLVHKGFPEGYCLWSSTTCLAFLMITSSDNSRYLYLGPAVTNNLRFFIYRLLFQTATSIV